MVVSVVVPLYNKAKYIKRALDSVLAQTYQDFEVIVVNDGSTDGSEKVVEQYADPRIRLVHQKNAGECASRNRGIAESRADLVAFLDADDEWLPAFLETILRLRRRLPDCGAYATAFCVVEREGKRRERDFEGIPAPPWEGIIPNFFRSDALCSSAVAVPRRMFDSVGLFPLGVRRGGDTDMWCRIALRYPMAFSTREGAIYHKEAEDRASVRVPAPEASEYYPARTIANALVSGCLPPGVSRVDLSEYLCKRLIWYASTCLAAGNRRAAREYLHQAATTRSYRREWLHWWIRAHVPAPLHAGAVRAVHVAKSMFARKPGSDWRLGTRVGGHGSDAAAGDRPMKTK